MPQREVSLDRENTTEKTLTVTHNLMKEQENDEGSNDCETMEDKTDLMVNDDFKQSAHNPLTSISETSHNKQILSDNESESVEHTITEVIRLGEPLIDFPNSLTHYYKYDMLFDTIRKNPMNYRNFTMNNGLLYLIENSGIRLCIPDIKIKGLRIRELLIMQAHSLLAHLGARKTTDYLKESYWWPMMAKDITDYSKSCQLCATAKSTMQKPYGLLQSLKVPERPWQAIGFDFVGPFPTSSNRHSKFDRIAVFIDH